MRRVGDSAIREAVTRGIPRLATMFVSTSMALVLGTLPLLAQAPSPPTPIPNWAPSATTTPPQQPAAPILKGPQTESKLPPPSAPQPAPQPGAPAANSTTITRPGAVAGATVPLSLAAQVSEESQPLDQGVVWRIFRDKPGPDGKLRAVSSHREATPTVRLEPGSYLVNAAHGRANLTRRITVAAGKAQSEKFVLNAGALKLQATLASGEPAPDNTVTYSIQSDDRDQLGNRQTVISTAKPGIAIRLNAGIYHIVSTYGDANSVVRADVTVEPGKITEVSVSHMAAKVTFRLVNRPGGEALPDTQWVIYSAQGDTIKESIGALPSHILAAGSYAVGARRAGQVYRQEFTVKAGDIADVEVLLR